jgi:hypothetical protein
MQAAWDAFSAAPSESIRTYGDILFTAVQRAIMCRVPAPIIQRDTGGPHHARTTEAFLKELQDKVASSFDWLFPCGSRPPYPGRCCRRRPLQGAA